MWTGFSSAYLFRPRQAGLYPCPSPAPGCYSCESLLVRSVGPFLPLPRSRRWFFTEMQCEVCFFITSGSLYAHSTPLCVLASVRMVDTACFQTWDESLGGFSSFHKPVWLALLLLLAHRSTVINSQMPSICHGFSGWQVLATTACYLLSQMHSVLFQLTDVWLFGTKTWIVFPWMHNCIEIYVSQESSYLHTNANIYFFHDEQQLFTSSSELSPFIS